MECKGCEKQLKGGFKQEDGSFLCAKCVIEQVEQGSRQYVQAKALNILDYMLQPGIRPTKKQLHEVRSWIRCLDMEREF